MAGAPIGRLLEVAPVVARHTEMDKHGRYPIDTALWLIGCLRRPDDATPTLDRICEMMFAGYPPAAAERLAVDGVSVHAARAMLEHEMAPAVELGISPAESPELMDPIIARCVAMLARD